MKVSACSRTRAEVEKRTNRDPLVGRGVVGVGEARQILNRGLVVDVEVGDVGSDCRGGGQTSSLAKQGKALTMSDVDRGDESRDEEVREILVREVALLSVDHRVEGASEARERGVHHADTLDKRFGVVGNVVEHVLWWTKESEPPHSGIRDGKSNSPRRWRLP